MKAFERESITALIASVNNRRQKVGDDLEDERAMDIGVRVELDVDIAAEFFRDVCGLDDMQGELELNERPPTPTGLAHWVEYMQLNKIAFNKAFRDHKVIFRISGQEIARFTSADVNKFELHLHDDESDKVPYWGFRIQQTGLTDSDMMGRLAYNKGERVALSIAGPVKEADLPEPDAQIGAEDDEEREEVPA